MQPLGGLVFVIGALRSELEVTCWGWERSLDFKDELCSSTSTWWKFITCSVVAGRGSRCWETAVQPRCPSVWVLTLAPGPSLPSTCISCCCWSGCHGSGDRKEVGGTRDGDVFGRGQAQRLISLCICNQRGAVASLPHSLLLPLRHRWMFPRRGDGACCNQEGCVCCESRRMVEEFLWARASRSAAESKAN